MNKKFSTLMAGLVLAGSFPVVAQNQHPTAVGKWGQGSEIPYRTQNTTPILNFGDVQGVRSGAFQYANPATPANNKFNDLKVQKIQEDQWYQLEVGETGANDSVLVQLRNYETGELYLKVVAQDNLTGQYAPATNPTLNSSLWKITVTDRTPGSFMYRFENKETGYYLSYNCAEATPVALTDLRADALLLGEKQKASTDVNKSDVSDWRWYTTDSKTTEFFGQSKLYTFSHDKKKVIGLAQNYRQGVVLVDIPYEALNSTDDEQMVANYNILKLTVRRAGARVLTANDINSMIDADGSYMNPLHAGTKANFKGAINDLTSGAYTAINTGIVAYRNESVASSIYAGYSILLQKSANVYFGVEQDATYEPDKNPTEHGGLKVGNITVLSDPSLVDNAANARFHWKVTYYPTPDSLVFEPLNASIIGTEDKKANKKWADTPLKDAAPAAYYNTINAAVAHVGGTAAAATSVPFNKLAYVPVALTSMNNTGVIDVKAVLTVGQSKNSAIGDATLAKARYGCPVSTDNVANMGIKLQFNHKYTYLKRTSVKNGLYFIKVKVDAANRTDYRKDGMNLVYNMWGQLMYDKQDDHQDYKQMPATQWVVEQDTCGVGFDQTPYVTIRNREYGADNTAAFHGQLYADGTNYYIINHADYNVKSNTVGKFDSNLFSCGDTLMLTEITDVAVKTNTKLGYKHFAKEPLMYETWAVKYSTADTYNNLNSNKYLAIDKKDGYLVVEENLWKDFEITPLKENVAFGYAGKDAGLVNLDRTVYTLKVRDNNVIDNNWTYVVVKDDASGNPYYQMAHMKDIDGKNVKLATFYFKADQMNATGDTTYSFVDATAWAKTADFKKEGWATSHELLNLVNESDYRVYAPRTYVANGFKQIGVKSQTAKTTYISLDTDPETVNSTFEFVKTPRSLYMPIGLDVTKGEMNTNINLYRKRGNAAISQATEHLFEDGNNQSGVTEGSYIKNFGYAGITAENVKPVGSKNNTTLYADSVISSNARMPQYLFMVSPDSVKDGRWCETNVHGYFPSESVADDADKSHHVFYNGYVAGRVLVNLNDSVNKNVSINMLDVARQFAFRNYTRLAFVEGIHMNVTAAEANKAFNVAAGEWLFILDGTITLKDLLTTVGNDLTVIDAKKFNTALAAGRIKANVLDGSHKNYAFSLRYTDDDHKDVLLESQNLEDTKTAATASRIGTFSQASWVQIMDGVPVLAQSTNINGDHTTIDGTANLSQLIAQAQIFNLAKSSELPTANEDLNTSAVTVIAGNGNVTVLNAAGKTVVISNMLGQTIANTVLTSDNQTIAASGIVVVAVEGEEAVKAIIK